jgi:3-deoxy-D-manno-octulosonate 8-phosphate phosphatase (KDO 8-P phosphatase)
MITSPRLKLSRTDVINRFKDVKLLSLDVDGILTDGGIYYLDDGQQIRKFNSKDGMGIKEVVKAGITMCWVTASNAPSIRHRAEALGVPYILINVEDKLEAVGALLAELEIEFSEIAHMGDDINDLPLLEAVGCPLTAADAVVEAKDAAAYITERIGGDAAVREICDLLITSRQA